MFDFKFSIIAGKAGAFTLPERTVGNRQAQLGFPGKPRLQIQYCIDAASSTPEQAAALLKQACPTLLVPSAESAARPTLPVSSNTSAAALWADPTCSPPCGWKCP